MKTKNIIKQRNRYLDKLSSDINIRITKQQNLLKKKKIGGTIGVNRYLLAS